MRAVGALVRLELLRMLVVSRWVPVLVLVALVAWLAGENVSVEWTNTRFEPGALDVHAAAANNLMYVGYLLFTAFVFLVGDSVARDRTSGWARLTRLRGASSGQLWAAKLIVLLGLAIALHTLLLAACVLWGALALGLPLTAEPSELARAASAAHGIALFPPVEATTDMWARQVGVAVHLALASAALGAAVVATSVRLGGPRLPVAFALLGLMTDYALTKAWDPWHLIGPGVRLLEGSAAHFAGDVLMSRSVSVAYFAGLLFAAALVGGVLYARSDP